MNTIRKLYKLNIMSGTIHPCSRVVTVNQITSGPRVIAKVARKRKADELEDPTPGHEARNELDTRADTICAGANFTCI
jgi:hypothetical protein